MLTVVKAGQIRNCGNIVFGVRKQLLGYGDAIIVYIAVYRKPCAFLKYRRKI